MSRTVEAWMRQRGTWPTTVQVLTRDLGLDRESARLHLRYLHQRGTAVALGSGRFVHANTLPEHCMATLVLLDANGDERHRADFPNRTRADIALRIVERDIRDRRPSVRVVGHDIHDSLYTVAGVARAMIQPTAQPEPERDEPAYDPRARAAGDDR